MNASDIPIPQVLEWIEEGMSYVDIAAKLGCSRPTLYKALSSDAATVDNSARARESSAEAWLDKGLLVVESALRKDGGIDASAARAYAQECARRAAIRNPKYRPTQDITSDGKALQTLAPVFNVTLTETEKPE